jgi:hypothetical protein
MTAEYEWGFEKGVDTERERIIKLLESKTGCGYEHYETEKCFCEAVELIKGSENVADEIDNMSEGKQ